MFGLYSILEPYTFNNLIIAGLDSEAKSVRVSLEHPKEQLTGLTDFANFFWT